MCFRCCLPYSAKVTPGRKDVNRIIQIFPFSSSSLALQASSVKSTEQLSDAPKGMAHFPLLHNIVTSFSAETKFSCLLSKEFNLLFFYIDGILKSVWILTPLTTDVEVPVHLAVQFVYVSNFFKVNLLLCRVFYQCKVDNWSINGCLYCHQVPSYLTFALFSLFFCCESREVDNSAIN